VKYPCLYVDVDERFWTKENDLLITYILSDEQLMLELQFGNFDAAALLFERWKRPLFNFFYRMTNKRTESEDFTQSVFERMIKYRSTYTKGMSFKTWLFQMARNISYTAYQKQEKRRTVYADWRLEADQSVPAIDRTMEKEEEKERIWQVLNRLPAAQKEILLLSKFQKLPYKEIGELFNCTEGAVKVKVHRAMAKLKTEYSKLPN